VRRVAVGWAALVAALFLVLVSLPGWPGIIVAAAATIGLAGDSRFGWLGAGLLVLVALPYGGAADVTNPISVGAIPIRPPDVIVLLALAGSLQRLSVPPRRPAGYLVALVAFLAVGIVGVGIGVLVGNDVRDILRDGRWWASYVAGVLAILGAARRPQIERALVVGATLYALLLVAAVVLPAIPGGLKALDIRYFAGTLRMQMSNSAFLVPATALVAWATLRSPSPWRMAWLGLLFAAQVMSLTRTSILVTVGVVALAAIVWAWSGYVGRPRTAIKRGAIVAATMGLAFVAAVGLVFVGLPGPASSQPLPPATNPLARITFTDSKTGVDAIAGSAVSGGRFATYVNALKIIEGSPIVGAGMGRLVDVGFAYSEPRAHSLYKQPGVDDAYLTVAVKAGAIGLVPFLAILLLPMLRAVRQRQIRGWFVPAWLGLLVLTLTQSFAVSSYGPFVVSLLGSLPFLGPPLRRRIFDRRDSAAA
jgi:hypothetical protein